MNHTDIIQVAIYIEASKSADRRTDYTMPNAKVKIVHVKPVKKPIIVDHHNGNVTLYGQTNFANNKELDVHKQYIIEFDFSFDSPPVVLMTAATYCSTVHKAGDIHMLSHTSDDGPGIGTDSFAIKSHQEHTGQVTVNWTATGQPKSGSIFGYAGQVATLAGLKY
ncbi:hypothetical protein ACN47E_000091 [Coniothyrium glycines]